MRREAVASAAQAASTSGRRVLVTGAGGFIGGHVCAALVRNGAFVRAFIRYGSRDDAGTLDRLDPALRSEVEVVAGDIRDLESVADAVRGCEIVLHLAAQIAIPYSYRNPRDFFETNVLGTLNVAQAARNADVARVVHTSTSEVYGTAKVVPMKEDHPIHAQSPYSASKVGADAVISSWFHAFALPVCTLRPFNTYGPHQSRRAIVPTILAQAVAGDVLRLGSLEPRRDLAFVDDTVAAFLAAATAPGIEGMTIHVGTGLDISIGELVALTAEIVERPLSVVVEEARIRPPWSEVGRLVCDPSRARAVLGWQPQVALREGLERTLMWMTALDPHPRAAQYVL